MESKTVTPSSWYYERIVSYLRYRPSMADSVRKEVRSFDDAIISTSIKHYVPWKRYIYPGAVSSINYIN